MNLIHKTLFALLIVFSNYAYSQDLQQTVKGKVRDVDSEIPLPGATIVLIGSNPIIGVISDIDGDYKFKNIPIGRQSFKISFIGYEDVYLKEILVETGRELVLNVMMKEALTQLESVVVIANDDRSEAINKMATVSANQITIESTSRIAAGINDPARTIQTVAGVATSSDKTNELVIRGNSPRGVLWRMEGIEIPNPNHFSSEGGSGGGVSALSTQVLANSDFLTSAFPAEYGNAISGVFDLKLRNGNSEKREYAVQLGVLGLQLAAEGPFKEGSQASYLFNYRYSTFSLLNKSIGSTIGGFIPTWQDLSFKVFLPTKKAGYFSLWGLGGNSIYEDLAVQDTTQWEYKSDYRQETSDNSLAVVGLTHKYQFNNPKAYISTIIANSYTKNNFMRDTLSFDYKPFTVLGLSYAYNTISVNSFVNYKFSPKNIVRVGASFSKRGFDTKAINYNYSTKEQEQISDSRGNTDSYQSYIQWKHRVSGSFDINTGLHSSYLALNGKYVIEPRLGVRWKINQANTVNLGLGLHSKSEPVSVYLFEEHLGDGTTIYPNEELDFTKAVHFVIGYNWNFAKDFRIKTEVYYQYIYSVPIDINDTTGTKSSLNFRTRIENAILTNDGTGRNYGVELTLEKFFSYDWYFLLTSALFESKYTMPGFEEKNTLFNSNYIMNLVAGKEYKFGTNKDNVIGLNIRTIWRGGYRNIPYDLDESIIQDSPVYDYDNAYEQRLKDYYRLDIGINYSKNKTDWIWKVSLDIQNITNVQNISRQYYDSEEKLISNVYMDGIVPNINLLIEF